MKTYITVVLAAGKGTRMRSALPKVLHPLAGVPLLGHVLNAVEAIPSTLNAISPETQVTTTHHPIVVLGNAAEQIKAAFGSRCHYAIQEELSGTGSAVLSAQSAVDALKPQPQTVLVCYGDTPLITGEMLARVVAEHLRRQATITFLTAHAPLPCDYGRIVRDAEGRVLEVVAVKRATEAQLRIGEVNSGVYCFDRAWLWSTLQSLPRNAVGEYYLTDAISIASSQGRTIATVLGSLEETIGINNRVQLAGAEQLYRRRILERHMYAGVTIIDPETTYINEGVEIGMDTVILPGTMITGNTRIGSECRIGPGTTVHQSIIGDRCIIRNSMVEESSFEDDVRFGPWSRCRNNSHLAHGVGIGNFVEIARSTLDSKSEMNHFSFVGDATVGEHVNIGAGTITCNFDGVQKNHTTIDDGAFIGSGTMLVAPVIVGEQAQTGAGSVVIRDVSPGVLVAGVPARVLRMSQMSQTAEGSIAEGSKKE